MSYRQVIYSICAVSRSRRGLRNAVTRKTAAYIAMASEVLEELDLTQGALGQDLLAEDIGNLLDGNTLTGMIVRGGAVRIVRSQAPLLYFLHLLQTHTRLCHKRLVPIPW